MGVTNLTQQEENLRVMKLRTELDDEIGTASATIIMLANRVRAAAVDVAQHGVTHRPDVAAFIYHERCEALMAAIYEREVSPGLSDRIWGWVHDAVNHYLLPPRLLLTDEDADKVRDLLGGKSKHEHNQPFEAFKGGN